MLECQNLLELEKRLARSETPGEGDIKKKNNLMFILVIFEFLSDILHWDYVCHSAIPWKIGVSEQFPVLVWSPTPPHPRPLLEQHYNPTSLQCKKKNKVINWYKSDNSVLLKNRFDYLVVRMLPNCELEPDNESFWDFHKLWHNNL